jgi:hypothetical protein
LVSLKRSHQPYQEAGVDKTSTPFQESWR